MSWALTIAGAKKRRATWCSAFHRPVNSIELQEATGQQSLICQ